MAVARESEAERRESRALVEAIDARCPFGPLFFVSQLRGFIRDRCPDSQARLPVLEIHLADGHELDVCHVVAIAPAWVALAVYECSPSGGSRKMRTEIVPYGMIARITVSTERSSEHALGFDANHPVNLVLKSAEPERSAEEALLSARGPQIE